MRQRDYLLGTLNFFTIFQFIHVNIDAFPLQSPFLFGLNISSTILEAFCGSGNVFTPSLLPSHSCIHDFLFQDDDIC